MPFLDVSSSALTSDAATRTNPLCPSCGYDLAGIAVDGTCPECAAPYTRELALTFEPSPGPWILGWRLGWPLLVLVLCGVAMAFAPDTVSISLPVAMLIAMRILATWFVVIPDTIGRHVRVADRSRTRVGSLRRLGTLPFAVGATHCVVAIGMGLALLAVFIFAGLVFLLDIWRILR